MLFPLLSKKHVLHTEAASIHSLLSYCWGSGTLHIKRHLGAAKHPPLQSFYNLVFTSSLLPLHFPPPIFSNLHSSLLINTPPSFFFFFFDPLELRGFLHLLILQCALIFIWVTVRFFLIFVSLAFHSLSSQTFSSSSLHIFLSICLSSPHPFSLVYPLSLSFLPLVCLSSLLSPFISASLSSGDSLEACSQGFGVRTDTHASRSAKSTACRPHAARTARTCTHKRHCWGPRVWEAG